MKRFLFTMMTLVALVLVANTTFGQGKTAPYIGGTYSYTVNDIGTNVDRAATTGEDTKVRIFFSTDTNPDADFVPGATTGVWTASNFSVDVAGDIDGTDTFNDEGSNVYGGALDDNNDVTDLSFDITYHNDDATETNLFANTVAVYLWVEVYDGADADECKNYMYIEITPISNNFDITIAGVVSSGGIGDDAVSHSGTITDLYCPTPLVSEGAAVSNLATGSYNPGATYLYFRVSKAGGEGNDWKFKVTFTDNGSFISGSLGTNGNYTIVSVTDNDATPETFTADGSGIYTIDSDEASVLITVAVDNLAGQADTDVTGTLTDMSEVTSGLVDAAGGADETDYVVLQTLPSIGGAIN